MILRRHFYDFTKLLKWTLIATLSLLLYSPLAAQNLDSIELADIHQHIWGNVLFNDPDSAFKLAQEHLKKSIEKDNLFYQAKAYNTMGVSHSVRGNYENATVFYFKSLDIRTKLNDIKGVASCLGNIGLCYQFQGRYQESVQYFTQSLEKYESINSTKGVGDALNNIGLVYQELEDYEEAQKYFLKALENYEKVNMIEQQVVTLTNLAICYADNGNTDEALAIYRKALSLNSQSGNKANLSLIYSQMGNAFLLSNQLDSALNTLEKGYQITTELEDANLSGAILFYIGKTYLNKGDSSKAEEYFAKSLDMSKSIATNSTKISALKHLAIIYSTHGNYESAYKFMQLYSNLNDSLRNSEISKEVTQAKFEYEYDKKKSLDDQARAEQRERELLFRYFLLVIVGIVAIFIVLLYRRYKFIRKQKNVIDLQAKELVSSNERLMDLNQFKETMNGMIVHDFKNSLNTILHFSESSNGNGKMSTIHQAGINMLNLVHNMLDIQKMEANSLQLNLSEEPFEKAMKESINRVQVLLEQKEIELDIENNISAVLQMDLDIIIRVLVNLLSNAIKFSPPNGKIIIRTEEKEGELKVWVIDEGEGIPKDQIKNVFEKYTQINARSSGNTRSTGIGLNFCKLAIEAHNGQIGVESVPDQGSVFWFKLHASSLISSKEEFKIAPRNLPILSPEIAEKLIPYVEELEKLDIFEFSKINDLLDRLEEWKDADLDNWIEALRMTIRHANVKRFNELLISIRKS